jgi:hypothetical protein
MKGFWITTLALASTGWAMAQDIPPLPLLRGDAASLKDTMKFIQAKLPGKVNYIVYGHDNVAGTDSTPLRRTLALSSVVADAESCRIIFHMLFDNGKGSNIIEKDNEIFLKQVQEIVLMQMDQVIQQANAKAGHPEQSAKVDPAIFLVVVRSESNHSMMFNFYDEALSERVSKALQHAVELCGGGKQEPF